MIFQHYVAIREGIAVALMKPLRKRHAPENSLADRGVETAPRRPQSKEQAALLQTDNVIYRARGGARAG